MENVIENTERRESSQMDVEDVRRSSFLPSLRCGHVFHWSGDESFEYYRRIEKEQMTLFA